MEHRVATDWGELHIETGGSGSPLLLLQGLGYASWAWRSQLEAFSEWSTVVVDNRGAGRSDKPDGPYSIVGMADDAAAALERLAGSPAHIVGFSMGGYIAQMLAVVRPDLVRSLVIVSSSSGGAGHEPTPDATIRAWTEASGLSPEEFARATMHLSFSPGWATRNAQQYEELLESRLKYPTPEHAWNAQYEACIDFLADGLDTGAIDVPTLVVHGDADRVVPVENGRRLESQIAGSRLVLLESRGHLSFVEDPATFNLVVAQFLREVEARSD